MANSKTPEDAQHVFAQYGLEISIDETNEIMSSMVDIAKNFSEPNDELSEDQLEMVAGGLGYRDLFGIAKTTWDIGTGIAGGLVWGSQKTPRKALQVSGKML